MSAVNGSGLTGRRVGSDPVRVNGSVRFTRLVQPVQTARLGPVRSGPVGSNRSSPSDPRLPVVAGKVTGKLQNAPF